MDNLHSGGRASFGFSVRLAVVVLLVAAALYGLGMWGARELVHLEPYTVEVNLLVPRLDMPRLARTLRVLQPILGAALIATMLVQHLRKRR